MDCAGTVIGTADERRLDKITKGIIGCSYKVANILGSGFLEKVYENALFHELHKQGYNVEQQKGIKIHYDGIIVGEYIADLLVEESVLVELKAVKMIEDIHMAQCLNYFKATNLQVCLLINFGAPHVEVKRIVNNY